MTAPSRLRTAPLRRAFAGAFIGALGVFLAPAILWPAGAEAQAPTQAQNLAQAETPGPRVVASILPLHSLAAAVMQGRGAPTLLLPGGSSPHDAGLRPSQAAALADAEVVFWVGPALETFLAKALPALAPGARRVALIDLPSLPLRPVRPAGLWGGEPHDHGADAGGGEGGHDVAGDVAGASRFNPHIWLDPEIAKRLAGGIAEALAAADPAGAALYRRNALALAQRLDALDARIAARLAPLQAVPFIVFHDAYVYYEARYGLTAWGGVTLTPNQPPGARRLAALRAAIRADRVACVFSEPQFRPALVDTLVAETGVRTASLDPLGVGLTPGPEAYFRLLENLTDSVVACLSGG